MDKAFLIAREPGRREGRDQCPVTCAYDEIPDAHFSRGWCIVSDRVFVIHAFTSLGD